MKNSLLIFICWLVIRTTFGTTVPGPAGPIGGPIKICIPASGIVFSTNPITGATGYVWTLPLGAVITGGANTFCITVNFSNTASSGFISVYGTNSNGNGQSSSVAITLSPYPNVPEISPPGPIPLCPGSTINLSVPPQTGATYCWYEISSPQWYSWNNVGTPGFSTGGIYYPSLKFSLTGQAYMAFEDAGHGQKVSVMKFNGTTWQYVGIPGFSAGMAAYESLEFSPSGEPYVAFMDDSDFDRVSVMRFDGNNWVYVGIPSFSAYVAWGITLKFSPTDGRPYVAFTDLQVGRLSVMKFDGTNWGYVGQEGFSISGCNCQGFAFSSSGVPYVAMQGPSPNLRAIVMKFDGINWVLVGSPYFSAGKVYYLTFTMDASDIPYVAYCDYADSSKATVMKFDGSNWQIVGNAGFSAGMVTYTSVAIGPDGKPNVAYRDYENGSKVSVMKFDGNNWVYIGESGFSAGVPANMSLAFNHEGLPYVGYSDESFNNKATVMKFSMNCNGNSSVYNVNAAGTYGMTITNPAGCTDSSSNLVMVFDAGPATLTINGPTSSCLDTLHSVSYTTSSGMASYSWTVSSGGSIISGAGTNTINIKWSALGNDTVSVHCTSMFSCPPQQAVIHVSVNQLPLPTISGITHLCNSSGYYYYNTEPGMSHYSWNVSSGGAIIGGSSTNQIQVTWNSAGNQWVSVYSTTPAGCTNFDAAVLNVEVDPLPGQGGNISGPQPVCAGTGNMVYQTDTISNTTVYVWSFPPGISVISGMGTNTVTVIADTFAISGDITVYGNNICGNGSVSPDFTLTVTPIPETPVITNIGNILKSNVPNGNQWYYEGNLIVGANAQTYDATLTGTGFYWNTVTINGCSSDTSSHRLVITTGFESNSSPVISVYPIPNDGRFIVSFSGSATEIFSIRIFNNLGDRIFEELNVDPDGMTNKLIDLRPLPNGIYTLMFTNNQKVYVSKVIVNY